MYTGVIYNASCFDVGLGGWLVDGRHLEMAWRFAPGAGA
jgi:hypothetical protein